MKQFICKDKLYSYYLIDSGMGGFLNPPGHAEHEKSIAIYRGGYNSGSLSLSGAIEYDYVPAKVKMIACRILKDTHYNAKDTTWINSVYNYFRSCYSPDGINRNADDCIIDRTNKLPAEHHLAYLFIKQYDPDHKPDLDKIQNIQVGAWGTK